MRLSRHAVVVVWPGDSGVVEVAVDGVVDSVGDDVPAGLDPSGAGREFPRSCVANGLFTFR